jgi:FkbM family methyltransferase
MKLGNSISHQREPSDIKLIRYFLRRWPLPRGKGVLLRLFASRFKQRDFLMEVEPGIHIPAKLDDYMVLWGFENGYDGIAAWQLSRLLIKSNDTIFDIGANIGLWLMGIAKRIGPNGSIHAFEPVPENLIRLNYNLSLNRIKNVICRQLAISNRNGRTTFYASNSDNSGRAGFIQRKGVEQKIDTEIKTLDTYCEENSIKNIKFIKIDIEGAEILVFRGATNVLSSEEAPIIMFELDDSLVSAFNETSISVKAFLNQYGYSLYRYNGKILESVDNVPFHKQDDLFALKSYHFEQHKVLQQLLKVNV